MAEACIQVLDMPDSLHGALTSPNRSQLNLGSGQACTMLELAQAVARVVGYRGELKLESGLADESQDIVIDTYRMRSTGWEPQIGLDAGLVQMYSDYKQQVRKLASA
jgi:GDP-L-fucose synthase